MGFFDLPAKAAVLCSKQFNGKYGCSVCLHPGVRLPNNARVYPPGVHCERTHSQVIAAAQKAEEDGTCVEGVFGCSPFASNLDLVASIPVDYMHNVLEGVTGWLMRAWFDSKSHNKPCYVVPRRFRIIDTQLLKQRPPKEFTRPPRSISKHLKYWKASEIRYWLVYYSLPLLLDHLPPLYWHHFALLVCALHILLGTNIAYSEDDAA